MKIGSLVQALNLAALETRFLHDAPPGFGIVTGFDPHEHLVQVRWLDGRLLWHCASEIEEADS